MSERDPLLQERAKTHGPFDQTAEVAQRLKNEMVRQGLHGLPDVQIEALELIATKIARIIKGNSKFKDHWDDIAGYAKLGSEACDE